jgi:hypothetical protein
MSNKPITDTGIRGFLKWFAREQPGLYKKIAPQLPKVAPAAFSDYDNGGWRTAGLSRDDAVDTLNEIYRGSYANRVGMGRLSDYADYLDPIVVYGTSGGSTGVNYTSELTAPSSYVSYTAPMTTPIEATAPPTVDTSTAANNGVSSSAVTSAIGAVIGATSAAYLTSQQAALQNQIIQTQLQRAQSGLAPLTTSLNAAGIPTVSVGASLSGSNLLLLAGLGIGAVLLLSGGSSSSGSAKK